MLFSFKDSTSKQNIFHSFFTCYLHSGWKNLILFPCDPHCLVIERIIIIAESVFRQYFETSISKKVGQISVRVRKMGVFWSITSWDIAFQIFFFKMAKQEKIYREMDEVLDYICFLTENLCNGKICGQPSWTCPWFTMRLLKSSHLAISYKFWKVFQGKYCQCCLHR